jgi:hypothetical protein
MASPCLLEDAPDCNWVGAGCQILKGYVPKITRGRATQNPLSEGHFLSRSLAPALFRAEVIREPGFWHDGPPPPDTWLHSDHLPVLAEVG